MESNFQNNEKFMLQNNKFWNAVEVPFTETKENIWKNLESKIDFNEQKVKVVKFNWIKYSIVAVFLLLIATTIFAKFYTENVSTAYAETKVHLLPDNSKVHLNAGSRLSFNPFWYRFNRRLHFEGEAFFEVAKGQKFKVVSTLGTTEVLGTSFNINSNENNYRVFCKTGLVSVYNTIDNDMVQLEPNQIAYIENNKLKNIKDADDSEEMAWLFGKFYFKRTPLLEVLNALEKEYNVDIHAQTLKKTDYIYTGYFQKQDNVLDALETVCLSLNLKVKKINEKEFSVSNAD